MINNSQRNIDPSPLEKHVGLGAAEKILQLVVTWPSAGSEQVSTDRPLDQRLLITGGSD